jgi:SAM-dependent methyltransferase
MLICSVCGGKSFRSNAVLWDELVAEWQLSPAERAYIDRQQGTSCDGCGNNLRSIALADALLAATGAPGTLQDFVASEAAAGLRVLEINEAGMLSPTLRRMPGHVLATYPAIDIHDMPYGPASFDVVVHSDSLEHVAQPVRALAECRRVLRPGGWLCFTIPVVIGRLTRSRAGLPKSYHGNPADSADDYVVQTEFGADMWTYVVEAGFQSVVINTVSFPDAVAISARRCG